MCEKVIIFLAVLAVLMSLAALCASFAMLEKIQRADNQTMENRASINRHTMRLRKLDDSIARIDLAINDVYETIGEQERLVRQFFVEAEQHEDSDKT